MPGFHLIGTVFRFVMQAKCTRITLVASITLIQACFVTGMDEARFAPSEFHGAEPPTG